MMKYTKISGTDLDVSVLSLGTWVFGGEGWKGTKDSDSMDAISAALDYGVNLIDTAPIYGFGRAEVVVGKAIKGRRDKVVIATKCGLVWDVPRSNRIKYNLSPISIEKELNDSLERLGTDYIDIYQCHWPDPDVVIEDTLEAMLKFQRQGKIKYIGVCNFDTGLLKKAYDIVDIVTTQNRYSLLSREVEKDILPFIRSTGIGMLAYGGLGGGILSGKYTDLPADFEPSDVRRFFYKYYNGRIFSDINLRLKAMQDIGRPLNQIALNWVRQQDGVVSVLVGCRDAIQAGQNFMAANWDLSERDIERINKIFM